MSKETQKNKGNSKKCKGSNNNPKTDDKDCSTNENCKK